MTKTIWAGLLATCLLTPPVYAHDHDDRDWGRRHDEARYDYARVIGVDPIVERERVRVDREHCWDERVRVEERRYGDPAGAALLGGVLGGAVGHQLGDRRDDRAVGTVVGAVLGVTLGHELAEGDGYRTRYVSERRCAVRPYVEYHDTVTGYRVSYRYRGQVYHTTTDYRPGRHIRVRVDVAPVRWQG